MVHKLKAQKQAEFAELAEVLFIAVLESEDDEDHGLLCGELTGAMSSKSNSPSKGGGNW